MIITIRTYRTFWFSGVSEVMDSRSMVWGLVLTSAVCVGSALVCLAFSLPPSALVGMLLIVLPILTLLWFQEMKIQDLEGIIRSGHRQIRRDVEDQGGRMARRYDETMQDIGDLNAELRRRVYR